MKKLNTVLLVLLAAGSTLPLTAADVREGLVSYWPLDSLTPSYTIQDVVSTNDLYTVAMDPSSFVPGKYGNALSFDGTNTYAYYQNFDLENNDTGLPVSRGRTFSVLMWVNAAGTSLPGDGRAFTEGASAINTPFLGIGKHATGATNSLRVQYRDNGNAMRVDRTSPTNGLPFDSQWRHVAWVANNGTGIIYLDGVPYATNTYTAGFSMGTLNTTTLGCLLRTTAALFYNGLLDDVAVWDRALSQAEVQDVMTNSIATPVPNFPPVFTVQPVGNTNLFVGDSYTLSGTVSTGRRPLTLQWQQNDVAIPDATNSTLTLANLAVTNSGAYTLIAANPGGSVTSTVAQLTVTGYPAPNLTNGMIAFWPLDEVDGPKTPDVVSGYDMNLVNITATNVVAGRWTNAFYFSGANQYLTRVNGPTEKLPVFPRTNSFSISAWVKAPWTDNRIVFGEGSPSANNPITTLSTDQTTSRPGIRAYSRRDAGTFVNVMGTTTVFDDTWHHILYVQEVRPTGTIAKMYVDGLPDSPTALVLRPLSVSTTSIGALVRSSPIAFFVGLIDDVAIWERALSPDEALLLATAPTPAAPPAFQPLALRKFSVNVPAVRRGGTVHLSWDISTSAQTATINPGVGDILPRTAFGLGSTNVVVTNDTTFTLTISRGAEVISNQVQVAVVDGIATGWTLLDNFDQHPAGPISGNRWWSQSVGTGAIATREGNRVAYMYNQSSGLGEVAVFPLTTLSITEGTARTVFFRFWSPANTNAVRDIAGVSDKALPFGFFATNNAGPALHFQTYTPDPTFDGTLQLGARNGFFSDLTWATTNTFVFESNTLYNVWIDVTNAPLAAFASDVFSVWVAKDGDPTRTLLFDQFVSDRDLFDIATPVGPTLDKLFLYGFYGNRGGIALAFDDCYLSDSGYLTTVPRAYGYTGPLPGNLQISSNGSQITLTWDVGTTLMESSALDGPWSPVVGAVAPSYTFTPGTAVKFYRSAL